MLDDYAAWPTLRDVRATDAQTNDVMRRLEQMGYVGGDEPEQPRGQR